ncbi:hypothetical protein L0F63_003822 [Massospora cicadina]|nr:hypothetical protein L0F63_003822 [Massospora cicadina]
MDIAFSHCVGVDIREITVKSAHQRFKDGTLTSLELTNCYLKRIQHMNPLLNAVIEINPDAKKVAQRLDIWFNKTGEFKGPLHGVPILVKENIGTNDLMNTTAGSYALMGARPMQNAKVIRLLKKAGAIILGKANLSEFSGDAFGFKLRLSGGHCG